jgi:hypothetical protein
VSAALLLVLPLVLSGQPLAEYPNAPATRIGNDLVIGGEYYRLGYFTTADPVKTVLEHFNHAWEAEGYPVTVDGDPRTQVIISAFYTRQGLVRSIVLTRHEGKTLGFTVLKDLWAKAKEGKPAELPPLEGALFANDLLTRSDAGGSQHRTAAFAQPLDAVWVARRDAWAKLGYALVKDSRVRRDDGHSQRVLELAKGFGSARGAAQFAAERGKATAPESGFAPASVDDPAAVPSQKNGSQQVLVTLVEIDAKTTAIDETWVMR